jgi:hypothetical protein
MIIMSGVDLGEVISGSFFKVLLWFIWRLDIY